MSNVVFEFGELIIKAEEIHSDEALGYRVELTICADGTPKNVFKRAIIYMENVNPSGVQAEQTADAAASALSAQLEDPIPPPHPGVWVARLIQKGPDRTLKSFARRCECSRTQIGSIVSGKRSITAKMAKLLGRATDTDPQEWIKMQAAYDAARRS